MTRKKFTEREVLETLAWQGIFIRCFRCKLPFFVRTDGSLSDAVFAASSGMRVMHMALKPEREHIHEIALGGADKPFNCRYSCSECHNIITNGTRATSAGSSKHRIAKIDRITGVTKGRPKREWPKRKFQKRIKPGG